MKKNKLQPKFLDPFDPSDAVPMQSTVAFKRPLSAHERVLRAIRTHSAIERMNSLPGDESFDDPDLDLLTPHQLTIDPETGEEMTAGEYVMLQHERAQARHDVAKDLEQRDKSKNSKKSKKVATPPQPASDESDDE